MMEAAPQLSLVDDFRSAKDPESATAAFVNITADLKHTATYREEEALKAALHTIERYSLHLDVQDKGCVFLQELVFFNNSAQFAIGKHGGIDAILTAMKKHLKGAAVQEQACGVLWTMSANSDDIKVEIAAKGGVLAVLTAMKEHPKVATVQQQACRTLWSISKHNHNNIEIATNVELSLF